MSSKRIQPAYAAWGMGLHFLPAETLLKESIRDMRNNRDNRDKCDKCDKKQAVYLPQHPDI